jgi:uncharacterized protein
LLTIAATTAAALTLLLTALSLNISRLRMRYRVSYGYDGHKDLEVAVRTHGNALEQSLLFLLLLALLESMGGSPTLLAASAIGFTLARVTHALAAFTRKLLLRQIAHVASVLLQLLCATAIAWRLLGV